MKSNVSSMKTTFAILGAILALASTAFAQDDPIPTQTFSFNASPISNIQL
jgi:hypothetical protein